MGANNTITIEGRKLLVNSLSTGTAIEFTHFAVGDGETPATPENATALTNQLFTVDVSKTQASSTEKGVTQVRGRFTNSNEKGDFYWRELGVYARTAGTENEPILFGYYNFENESNYIPSVGVESVIEQGIIAQIVTGNAQVVYITDPTAQATLQDLQECVQSVENKLAVFTAENLSDIEQQISTLQESITEATNELNKATEGHVLKAGDTMTGDLNMGAHKVIGSLEGSSSMWGGWQVFSSIAELNEATGNNFDETTTMLELGQAMPDRSRLIHATSSTGAKRSPECYPHKNGVLEILRVSENRCVYTYSNTTDGLKWHSSIHQDAPYWKGWQFANGALRGSLTIYAGEEAPFGYMLCHGQALSVEQNAELFAVLGYRYGGSGDTFNIPDTRGMFLRGYDAGRGVDSGRKLGTTQQSGAPNIKGTLVETGAYLETAAGAFSVGNKQNRMRDDILDMPGDGTLLFDASRSSGVYQNGLNEVRPVNIAVNFIIKY